MRGCKLPSCSASHLWGSGPWGECVWEGCGRKGKQTRRIYCLDAHGRKVSKRHCKKKVVGSMKPAKKRKCPKKLCGFSSCQDVKKKGASQGDGEYPILLGGRNISVFCHQMESNWPKEFLSLPKGEQENYSEVYGMRLLSPNSCPNNGSREPDCPCVRDDSPRAGMTVWTKIQLNITALSVNSYDFTFARKLHGEVVPYGEAGDCYSTANCPQGKFSINLTGTGLRVAAYTGWIGVGNRPSLWLQRIQDNQVIYGKCGGYCGTCEPEHHKGLKLDVLPY